MSFNYNAMEEELVHTVMEEEAISGLSGETTVVNYDQEIDEDVMTRHPFKYVLSLVLVAAIVAGSIFGLSQLSTVYAYTEQEQAYQDCLSAIADNDMTAAEMVVDKLLEQDASNLQYLSLKDTICEATGDTEAHIDTLLKIIKADEDNYFAYEKLLQLYLDGENQSGIASLLLSAPNATIANMVRSCIVESPSFIAEPGSYTYATELEIICPEGLNLYYTLDGTSPKEHGHLYLNPISLTEGITTVKAVCCNEHGIYGDEISGEYRIGNVSYMETSTSAQVSQPTIYPSGGTYTSSQLITIDVPIGCQAYYSWTYGEELTPENGTLYVGSITMPNGDSTLSVIVKDEQGNTSAVKQVTYCLTSEP